MLGVQDQASNWAEGRTTAPQSATFATAPEGLSARRVERWLDLPPGAWQRRRLYALRLAGQAFTSLGFRTGDLVVVEPGAREQPGSIVVTRSPQGSSLRRIPPSMHGERRMPTVLELPLKERVLHRGEHVVGTVIGLLRTTGTGALRPVPLISARPVPRRRIPGRLRHDAAQARAGSECSSEIPLEQLRSIEHRWHQWVATARERELSPAQRDRWERLDSSLVTLCDCLDRTHVAEIRRALFDEAQALAREVHAEMANATRG